MMAVLDPRTKYLGKSIWSWKLYVNHYALLGISVGLMSNDQILVGMYAVRTWSKYLPDEIRRESKVWLGST